MPYRPTERTEAKRAATRYGIVRAALELVARGGYREAQVAAVADGVVVGSALVNCIRENLGAPEKITARLAAVAGELSGGAQR